MDFGKANDESGGPIESQTDVLKVGNETVIKQNSSLNKTIEEE